MPILNLTQHQVTPEQDAAGVFDADEYVRSEIVALLTFDEAPSSLNILIRATALADIANQHRPLDGVMIGGAPWLMGTLEYKLREYGIQPMYAFSRRESVEQVMADGSVRKVNVFKHAGWVKP